MNPQEIDRLEKAIAFIENQWSYFTLKAKREPNNIQHEKLEIIAQDFFKAKELLWDAIFMGAKNL